MEAFIESRQATRRLLAPALNKKRKEKTIPSLDDSHIGDDVSQNFVVIFSLAIVFQSVVLVVMWSVIIALLVSGENPGPNSEFAATRVLILWRFKTCTSRL